MLGKLGEYENSIFEDEFLEEVFGGENLYVSFEDNPLNFIDVFGLECCCKSLNIRFKGKPKSKVTDANTGKVITLHKLGPRYEIPELSTSTGTKLGAGFAFEVIFTVAGNESECKYRQLITSIGKLQFRGESARYWVKSGSHHRRRSRLHLITQSIETDKETYLKTLEKIKKRTDPVLDIYNESFGFGDKTPLHTLTEIENRKGETQVKYIDIPSIGSPKHRAKEIVGARKAANVLIYCKGSDEQQPIYHEFAFDITYRTKKEQGKWVWYRTSKSKYPTEEVNKP